MNYLTVQDMLWINQQVTKKTQSFNYAKLEEATFYQYAYGNSTSILSQAGRFLSGFAKKKPFAAGSEVTAFVGTVAFLKLNGMSLNLSDDTAHHWIDRSTRDSSAAMEALTEIVRESDGPDEHKEPSVRDAIYDVLDSYPKTISLMSRSLVGV